MIELQLLIQYWKQKTEPHPSITTLYWHDVLRATIYYLDELKRIKEVTK